MTEYKILSMNMQTDGPGHPFAKRADVVKKVITDIRPDLIGSQELTDHMMPHLKELKESYGFYGEPRGSLIVNEHNFIIYRKDRFRLLSGETLWLSNTPARKASKTFLSQFPRIVTIAFFKDRKTDISFTMFNTHLDHNFVIVRSKQADILREIIRTHAKGSFCLLTGDFNTITGSKALHIIQETGLQDCVPISIGSSMRHAADIKRYHNQSIDHIFLSSNLQVNEVKKITTNENGRYPSDHYPILARIAL